MTVTADYYLNTYGGVEYDNLEQLLKRAAMIVGGVISAEPAGSFQETCYANAVCAQAEQIGSAGGVEAWVSAEGSSFTIGSFSMSGGSDAGQGTSGSTGTVCASARQYLEQGGLIYRGVSAI